VAVTMPLLGFGLVFLLIAPMALTSFALAFWLLARGFAERGKPVRGDVGGSMPAGLKQDHAYS
jgi:hypothetical protein